MSLEITTPSGGGNANVRVTDSSKTICAEGTASRPGSVFPSAVYAKVYASDPGTVTSPPVGATQRSLTSNSTWQFRGVQEIPNASCGNSSPYPENWLIVWAQYADLGNPYDNAKTTFNGVCATKTDCDN